MERLGFRDARRAYTLREMERAGNAEFLTGFIRLFGDNVADGNKLPRRGSFLMQRAWV